MRSLIIDHNEIDENVHKIKISNKILNKLLQNKSFRLFNSSNIYIVNSLYKDILSISALIYIGCINPINIYRDIITRITDYFYYLKLFCVHNNSQTNILVDDFNIIFRISSEFSNKMIHYKLNDPNTCKTCGVNFTYLYNQFACPKCFVPKLDLADIDNPNDDADEIKHDKRNIIKHLDDIMKKIYGNESKKKSSDNRLPDEVIHIFRQRLEESGIDIRKSIHYTYSLQQYMQDAKPIQYNGKEYLMKKYKEQTNNILLRMYPDDIKIPRLSSVVFDIISEVFMTISSAFQQEYPTKYSNNYMYTLFKIIYAYFPYNKNARQLLRFIYIQKPSSFKSKDDKLKCVNDVIGIFDKFIYTSDDIYSNNIYYYTELDLYQK